jgi:hypothetical protein
MSAFLAGGHGCWICQRILLFLSEDRIDFGFLLGTMRYAKRRELAANALSMADRRVRVLSTMGFTPTHTLSVGLFQGSWWREQA